MKENPLRPHIFIAATVWPALTYCARIPGAQRIPLQIKAAIADPNLDVLQRRIAAAAARRDPHHPDGLRREQIHLPPRRHLLLCFRALLFVGILVAQLAVVGQAGRAGARRRRLIGRLAVRNIRTCESRKAPSNMRTFSHINSELFMLRGRNIVCELIGVGCGYDLPQICSFRLPIQWIRRFFRWPTDAKKNIDSNTICKRTDVEWCFAIATMCNANADGLPMEMAFVRTFPSTKWPGHYNGGGGTSDSEPSH